MVDGGGKELVGAWGIEVEEREVGGVVLDLVVREEEGVDGWEKERSGMKDRQTLEGGRGNFMGARHGGDGQVQLQSEESIRRMRQVWKEYQARRVMEGNGVVYHQPQIGMTVDLEGRKMLVAGDKHRKKW